MGGWIISSTNDPGTTRYLHVKEGGRTLNLHHIQKLTQNGLTT